MKAQDREAKDTQSAGPCFTASTAGGKRQTLQSHDCSTC